MKFEVVVMNQDKGKTLMDTTIFAHNKSELLIFLGTNLGETLEQGDNIKISIRKVETKMEVEEYVEDTILNYCHANDIHLDTEKLSEAVVNVTGFLTQRGIIQVKDIKDDVLAELVNREVENS